MSYSINKLKEKSIPMPVTQVSMMVAEMFADEQPTLSKRRQVYLNTLAVDVMNHYMQMMQIPTELKKSDSWHPVLRLCADVADLKLVGLGHLECRPIKPVSLSQPVNVLCELPEEIPDDRIGCVVVEIDESSRQANLLGFTKTVLSGDLLITQLFHMDEFEEYLEVLSSKSIEPSNKPVDLGQWLRKIFEPGWETIETLMAEEPDQLASALRSPPPRSLSSEIGRAKLVQIKDQRVSKVVVLVVIVPQSLYTFETSEPAEIDIKVQVNGRSGDPYLPPDLQILVLNQEGVAVMGVQATSASDSIQLEFSVSPGERFAVKLALGEAEVIEHFVIQ